MKHGIFGLIMMVAVFVAETHGADKVRIGVSNYNLSNLSVGVAQTRDFFKEEGIDAEIIRMNPNVATMALINGSADYTTLVGSTVGAAMKGAKLKLVVCSQDRTSLALVSKSEFTSVKDLRGKILAVGSYGNTADIVARMIFKYYGLDPQSDIKVLALGPDEAKLAALKGGVVDVIIVAPPMDSEAKKLGFNILSRAGDIFQFPYNGLAATVKRINENPDQVKRVIRALIKANGFIRKNREGTIQVLIDWTRTKPEFAAAAYDSSSGLFSENGSIPEDGLRIVIENLRRSFGIERQVSLSEVSDGTILREAQKELGLKN